MNNRLSIGILGVGAIGSVISSILNQNNSLQLFYYNRSPKKRIQVTLSNKKIIYPIKVNTSINKPENLNWLIVCLKEHQYVTAGNFLNNLISPNTNVAVIRNGLQLKEHLLEFSSEQNILECIIDCPVELMNDGSYNQLSKPIITIPKSMLSLEFSNFFIADQAVINITEDFKTESWKKVCESASLGAILCLSGETCRVFKDKKLRDLYLKLLKEIIIVACADGAKIKGNFEDSMFKKVLSYPGTKGSSMLTDRLKGSPIELGAKNGIVSKLAKVYGIETPINDLMVDLLSNNYSQKQIDNELQHFVRKSSYYPYESS